MKNDLTPKQAAMIVAIRLINAEIGEDFPCVMSLVTNPFETKLVEQQLKLLADTLLVKARLTTAQEFHNL